MKKKLISVILASALTVGLLSACGSNSAKDNDVNSKTDTTETGSNITKSDTSSAPVSVTLNEVAHSIFYAPMYVAIENGYFEDEGIELTLVTGFGADKTMTAVISGEADIGFMGSEASIYTYNEGANDSVVNFAQLTQRAGNFLVAREEMKDFKWTDLKGKDVLGGRKGDYDFVHPNDHVNFGQSTSDVIQTAGKIAVVKQLKKLQVELKKLYNSYLDKAEEFKNVIKTGRTHLQEALPITLGQEFYAYASALNRDIKRIDTAIDALLEVNLGGTAIGTGLNANEKYCKKVILHLSKFSGEDVRIAKNLIDATRNLDAFGYASSMLKLLAIDLSKTASDLRLMASSGPNGFNEIILPNVQPGSSIMPGKFNPVIPEVVNQVCFYVMGLDVTVTKAIEAGQLELNVFEPLILMSLFEEITTLRRAARTFNNLAITDLKVNPNLKYHIDNSVFLITALTPHIGYDTACSIVNEAMKENKTIKEIVLEKGLLSNSLIDEILNNRDITSSGIAGESILKGTK